MHEEYLVHYGTKYHSGRYPYGSGEDPYQHDGGLRGAIKDLKSKGLSEAEIAQNFGWSIQEMRDRASIEKVLERNAIREKALKLFDQGMNYSQIGKELGTTDNAVRSFLDPIKHERNNIALNTANVIRSEVDKNGFTSIGKGMAQRMGISGTKLDVAVRMLEMEGYHVYNIPITQSGTNKKIQMQVIAPPEMTWADCLRNKDKVNIVSDPYTEDGGKTWENIEKPKSISSSRVFVRGKDEGGPDKDGLIEIKPGVKDIDLGGRSYAQVRIAVDDTNYMKGMAVYGNPKDFPPGCDIIYNSNKDKNDFNKVFKPMKRMDDNDPNSPVNWDNPFGAAIKADEYDDEGNLVREIGQHHYIDDDGNKQLSLINIINAEGDWSKWSKKLSSQFGSKQSPKMIEKQLNLAYDAKYQELEEIRACTNPIVKEKLYMSFADDCDSAAVHLKAAPLPGQQSHVLIPFPNISKNEVYAPNYENGTIVSLVRHPHEGIYQIPTLVVNNNVRNARRILGNAPDAIGIHPAVAQQLSGADFDGDTVIVLPNPNGKLIKSIHMQTHPVYSELADYDTKIWKKSDDQPKTGLYKRDPHGKVLSGDGFHEQKEMGQISNLITDMTLIGADPQELVRATKYSMTVIDAEKHNLDWRAAYKAYDIASLKKKYQPEGGAGTLVSRAKNERRVPERKQFYTNMINKETGEIEWDAIDPKTGKPKNLTGRYIKKWDPVKKEYYDTDIPAQTKTTAMAITKDAYELSSGTIIEAKYANYANSMKALANTARKEMVNLEKMPYSKTAAGIYSNEVASIKAKLNNALKNKPLEMKAQAIADAKINILKDAHPDWDKQDVKKHKALLLREARNRMGGGKRYRIALTPKEWEAIENGAITANIFRQVLQNTDIDEVKAYATPREYKPKLTTAQIAYAKSLYANGHYTQAQIASMLGVSTSTLNRVVSGKE